MRYVYAILPAEQPVRIDVAGVDDEDAEVCMVCHRGLAAVVSATARDDYRRLPQREMLRKLGAHQRVVEALMDDFPTILPVRFGTIIPDEARVYRLLEQGKDLCRANLERLAGLVQMEVVVTWELTQVFAAIGAEEAIARGKARLEALPPAEMEAERVALGRLVQAALQRRRQELAALLLEQLRTVTRALTINALMDDSMVVNVGLLLHRDGLRALDQQIAALDAQFAEQLHFRCVGPLPPYSFATVDVRLPSFEEVTAARHRLDLGQEATRGQIQQAYRRQLIRHHPDLNPDDPEPAAQIAELTAACALLLAYAASRTATGDEPCSFSRQTVEQTLIIAFAEQQADRSAVAPNPVSAA